MQLRQDSRSQRPPRPSHTTIEVCNVVAQDTSSMCDYRLLYIIRLLEELVGQMPVDLLARVIDKQSLWLWYI